MDSEHIHVVYHLDYTLLYYTTSLYIVVYPYHI